MNLLRTLIFALILALLIGNDDVSCGNNKKKQGKAHKASSSKHKQKDKQVAEATVDDISSSYIEYLKAKNYPCLYDKTLFSNHPDESKVKPKKVREYYKNILTKCRAQFDQIFEQWIEKQGEFGQAIKIWSNTVDRIMSEIPKAVNRIVTMENIRVDPRFKQIITEPFKEVYENRLKILAKAKNNDFDDDLEIPIDSRDEIQWKAFEFGWGLCSMLKEEPVKSMIDRFYAISEDILSSGSKLAKDEYGLFFNSLTQPDDLKTQTTTGRFIVLRLLCGNLNYFDSEHRRFAFGFVAEEGTTGKVRSLDYSQHFSEKIVQLYKKRGFENFADSPDSEKDVESLGDEFRLIDLENDFLDKIAKSFEEESGIKVNRHRAVPPMMQHKELCSKWNLYPLKEALQSFTIMRQYGKREDFLTLVQAFNDIINACLIEFHDNIEEALEPIIETAEYKRVRKFIDGLVDYIRGYKGKQDVKFIRDESGEIRVVKPESSESTSVAGSTTDENNRQYVSYIKLLNVRGSITRPIELEFFFKHKIEGFDLIQAYLDGSQICELFETDQWKKLINTDSDMLGIFVILNDLYRSPVLRSSYAHEVLDLFDLWTICKQITLLPLDTGTSSK